MVSWCRVLLPIALLVAAASCGDDALPGCDPDATCEGSTTTAGTDGDTTAADDADGTAASSDGGSTGGNSTTAASSNTGVDDTLDTGPSESDSGDSGDSTGASDDAEYHAVAIIGGLDRIRIFKHNLVTDHCTWITLVFPGSPSRFDVTTPEGWSVESIEISDVGQACDSDSPQMFGAETATSATGTIEFGDRGDVYPCLVSPDVEAAFAGVLPGIPPTDTLVASDIPVDGC